MESLCSFWRIPAVLARAVFAVSQFQMGGWPRYLSLPSGESAVLMNFAWWDLRSRDLQEERVEVDVFV